jgi:hypothetical protein
MTLTPTALHLQTTNRRPDTKTLARSVRGQRAVQLLLQVLGNTRLPFPVCVSISDKTLLTSVANEHFSLCLTNHNALQTYGGAAV